MDVAAPADSPTTAAALAAAARASLAAFIPDNAVFLAQRAADEWPSEVHEHENEGNAFRPPHARYGPGRPVGGGVGDRVAPGEEGMYLVPHGPW